MLVWHVKRITICNYPQVCKTKWSDTRVVEGAVSAEGKGKGENDGRMKVPSDSARCNVLRIVSDLQVRRSGPFVGGM